MNSAQEKAEALFKQYEAANVAGDFETISKLYNSTFLFGLPQGTRTVNVVDFVKLVSKRREEFRAKGLSATHLKSVEAHTIDANYIQAKVAFEMQIDGAIKTTFATYIIFDDGNQLQIVLQIDHQNLVEELKR
jgi:hypothetical protein